MKRHEFIGLFFLTGAAAWASVYQDLLGPIDTRVKGVALAMPVYLLILLGCYALYSVGIALVTFGDCDVAAAELSKEVDEVRAGLRKLGYKVPPAPKQK